MSKFHNRPAFVLGVNLQKEPADMKLAKHIALQRAVPQVSDRTGPFLLTASSSAFWKLWKLSFHRNSQHLEVCPAQQRPRPDEGPSSCHRFRSWTQSHRSHAGI